MAWCLRGGRVYHVHKESPFNWRTNSGLIQDILIDVILDDRCDIYSVFICFFCCRLFYLKLFGLALFARNTYLILSILHIVILPLPVRFSLYIRYLLHVCLSWQRDPSSQDLFRPSFLSVIITFYLLTWLLRSGNAVALWYTASVQMWKQVVNKPAVYHTYSIWKRETGQTLKSLPNLSVVNFCLILKTNFMIQLFPTVLLIVVPHQHYLFLFLPPNKCFR